MFQMKSTQMHLTINFKTKLFKTLPEGLKHPQRDSLNSWWWGHWNRIHPISALMNPMYEKRSSAISRNSHVGTTFVKKKEEIKIVTNRFIFVTFYKNKITCRLLHKYKLTLLNIQCTPSYRYLDFVKFWPVMMSFELYQEKNHHIPRGPLC